MLTELIEKIIPKKIEVRVISNQLILGEFDNNNQYQKYWTQKLKIFKGYQEIKTEKGTQLFPIHEEVTSGMYEVTFTDLRGNTYQKRHFGLPPEVGSIHKIKMN